MANQCKTHFGNSIEQLWASENRSKPERMRCKTASKLKKLVELVGFAPKDVIVSYKVFKINARVDEKLVPLACVNDDCEVARLTEELVNQDVRDAMNAFVADLE